MHGCFIINSIALAAEVSNCVTKFCVIIWNEQRIKVIKVSISEFFCNFRLKTQRLNDTQNLSDVPHKSQNMLQFNFLRRAPLRKISPRELHLTEWLINFHKTPLRRLKSGAIRESFVCVNNYRGGKLVWIIWHPVLSID